MHVTSWVGSDANGILRVAGSLVFSKSGRFTNVGMIEAIGNTFHKMIWKTWIYSNL